MRGKKAEAGREGKSALSSRTSESSSMSRERCVSSFYFFSDARLVRPARQALEKRPLAGTVENLAYIYIRCFGAVWTAKRKRWPARARLHYNLLNGSTERHLAI